MPPGIIILFIGIALSAFLSISLFREKRYHSITGWLIILLVFLFFAYRAFWRPKSKRFVKNRGKHDSISGKFIDIGAMNDENFVQLTTTKDCIKVHAIKNALIDNDINCVVLDQHSTRMMFYLPDVEMRIMVPKKDFENSITIIETLAAKEK